MQKIRYPSLAAAVGAFVAAEFEACQAEPARLLVEGQPVKVFTVGLFEEHLVGLLEDLVELCSSLYNPYKHTGAVALVVAMGEELWQKNPDGSHRAVHADAREYEWQACAQGYARIEGCN